MVTLAFAGSGPDKFHLVFSPFFASLGVLCVKSFYRRDRKGLAEIAKQTFSLKVRLQELLLWTKMMDNSLVFVVSLL
jgi:hypothetical protein